MKIIPLITIGKGGELHAPNSGPLEISDEEGAQLIAQGYAKEAQAEVEPKAAAKPKGKTVTEGDAE